METVARAAAQREQCASGLRRGRGLRGLRDPCEPRAPTCAPSWRSRNALGGNGPNIPPLDLRAVPLEPPLAKSYRLAESFFATADPADGPAIWGRDLVTLALLARDDPSLDELAAVAGTTVDDLRAGWQRFVRNSGQRRSADEWDRWWQAAGVGLAGATAMKTMDRDAYLLTWNPARYSESQLGEQLRHQDPDGSVTFGWSSGNNQSMAGGDRVFLLRQGPGMRGLVGVGTVSAAPRESAHSDASKRAEGRTSWIVEVRWEAIDVEPMVELSTLERTTGESRLWATQVGGVAIDPAVRDRLEEIWPAAWERRRHHLPPVHVTDVTPKHLIARFDPDHGAATDSLNVQRYVDAFARVAISQALTPPLSVGIFGDWGSGKTFFMEQIAAKIKQLADGGENPDSYVRNVCQMSFNAWHYAETDLWASLITTIFQELRHHLDGDKRDADKFNTLLNQLEIAQVLQENAKKDLEDKKSELEKAQTHVKEAEQKLSEFPRATPPQDAELRAILTKNVRAVIKRDNLPHLLHGAFELTGDKTFETAADAVERGQTTVEDANSLLVDARALTARAGFWWRLLTTARLHQTRAFWAVLGAAVAIPVLFVVIQSRVDFPVGWAAGLLEAITAIGALVLRVRAALAQAAPVFSGLDRVQASIQRAIEDARNRDRAQYEEARTRALRNEAAARRELEKARETHDQAESAVEAAEVALRESTSQARLGRFIRERAASADYEKYLGLIAMVHRDFEQLAKLMDPADNSYDPNMPHIDRIILYIDDLDRCYPPEKVVRVLEAVHLLLFFPLFVVFVGVDSRWVSRALNRHYDQMLRDEALPRDTVGASPAPAPANSQDFLEKIF